MCPTGKLKIHITVQKIYVCVKDYLKMKRMGLDLLKHILWSRHYVLIGYSFFFYLSLPSKTIRFKQTHYEFHVRLEISNSLVTLRFIVWNEWTSKEFFRTGEHTNMASICFFIPLPNPQLNINLIGVNEILLVVKCNQ